MFYLDLFAALARHRVQYLLIGGLAVSMHGVERATMNVDITLSDIEHLKRIKAL